MATAIPTYPNTPQRWQAIELAARLAAALGAVPGPGHTAERLQLESPSGCRVSCVTAQARVIVADELSRLDVTILGDRVAVAFQGDSSGEAILGLYMLDALIEGRELPGKPERLGSLQLADLSDLRRDLEGKEV